MAILQSPLSVYVARPQPCLDDQRRIHESQQGSAPLDVSGADAITLKEL